MKPQENPSGCEAFQVVAAFLAFCGTIASSISMAVPMFPSVFDRLGFYFIVFLCYMAAIRPHEMGYPRRWEQDR